MLDLMFIVINRKFGSSFPTGVSFTFGLIALILLELLLVIDGTYNQELSVFVPLVLLIGITKWCIRPVNTIR